MATDQQIRHSLYAPIVSYAVSIVSYLIATGLHSTFAPTKWAWPTVAIVSTIFIFAIAYSIGAFSQARNDDFVERFLTNLVDLYEYQKSGRKPFDLVLTHYTDVATVGAFLMLLVFGTSKLIDLTGSVAAAIGALGYLITATIYALLFCKIAFVFSKFTYSKYMFVIMPLFVVDVCLLTLLVKSVPK